MGPAKAYNVEVTETRRFVAHRFPAPYAGHDYYMAWPGHHVNGPGKCCIEVHGRRDFRIRGREEVFRCLGDAVRVFVQGGRNNDGRGW